jgi:hypothetical protein
MLLAGLIAAAVAKLHDSSCTAGLLLRLHGWILQALTS